MLRTVAFALLGLAAVSQPISLLCNVHCAAMASEPAPPVHLRAGRSENIQPCCSEPQFVADSPARPQGQPPAIGPAQGGLLFASVSSDSLSSVPLLLDHDHSPHSNSPPAILVLRI